jgi:hypothetical protein
MPDCSEGFEYLALFESIRSPSDVYLIKSRIIKKMGALIEFKELGYSNYEEVLKDVDVMRSALDDISQAIYMDIMEYLGKKNSSLMP